MQQNQANSCTFHSPIVPFIREADFAVRRPWRVPVRRLLDYLLIYIQEGECHISGEFCLIQPNDLHTLEGTTNTITPYVHMDIFYHPRREESFPTRAYQVDLSPCQHLLQPRLNDWENLHIPVKFSPAHPVWFRETMLKMIGSWQQHSVVSQLEAQYHATALVLSLLQEQRQRSPEILQEPQSLNWITSYLSFHLDEPISVTEMAHRAHLSVSRFSKLFRQQFGLSPHQYLLHLRIQYAENLLQHTDLSIEDIAHACGFADVQHFSKAFKKRMRCTPGRYRSRNPTHR
jgi:AraC-like DNA-binding protein